MLKPFLTAEWRKLLLVNYPIDSEVLKPFLPYGTELDFFEGKCLMSMVGFMFLNTRLKGIRVPFHQQFEEVNLRFYVLYKENGFWKRGACFIGEFVPKPMIALVARTWYGEPYSWKRMDHKWEIGQPDLEVSYRWKTRHWNVLTLKAENRLIDLEAGSEAEFILEHYWGYTRNGAEKTSEYAVEHPRWHIYPTLGWQVEMDFMENYGRAFEVLNQTDASSAFLAEGSEVMVREGRKLF